MEKKFKCQIKQNLLRELFQAAFDIIVINSIKGGVPLNLRLKNQIGYKINLYNSDQLIKEDCNLWPLR
jgi:hypothetical protein